jgi:hypothetical protein
MVRLVRTDREKGLLMLEVRKSEIEDILSSIDAMTELQQIFLLVNLPATEEDRRRVDRFKHLREDFRKLKPITWVIRRRTSFSGNFLVKCILKMQG